MNDNRKSLQDLLENIAFNTSFRAENIPDIDLYMDQIIGLINGAFAGDAGDEKEKLLTKTMIHNYSKEGLIKPVKGKKYSKEHIIQMLLVYQLKNTIKISDIKDTLKEIYKKDSYNEKYLTNCFDRYMEHREEMMKESEVFINHLIEEKELDLNSEDDLLVLLMDMAGASYYFKILTEAISRRIRTK